MKLEEAFAKVVGRPASDDERERLVRLRDALEVQDNDALWAIVMALELYDSLYREYPEKLAAETAKAIEGARRAFADAARAEAVKVHALLARQVARSGAELARTLAGRSVGMPWLAAAGAALVGFGALCVSAGVVLGSGARPFWAARTAGAGARAAFAMVMGAPAGWMMFALLLPVAGCGVGSGWKLAREGVQEGRGWIGWAVIAVSMLGALGCVALLLEVL